MSIVIVPAGRTISELRIVTPEFSDGKVQCILCKRMVFRQNAERTNEGWACPRCTEEN
ncbi:MAG TPA: hypothetical protein VMU12_01170 [Candidatus Paceibacterota bacterium]|nr:hypothetical protein [Candidatus Paceibacterota bacterium]